MSRARILPRVPGGLPRVRPGPAVTRLAPGHQPGAADTQDTDTGEAKYSETLNSEKTFVGIICKLVSTCLSVHCIAVMDTVSHVLTITHDQLTAAQCHDAGVGECGPGVRAGDAGGSAQRREKRAPGPATGSSSVTSQCRHHGPVTQQGGTE